MSPVLDTRTKPVVRHSLLTFGGVVFGGAAAFFTALIVSNSAGTTGAGIFFQFVAAFAIVTTVLTLGADTGLVRFVSARRATGERSSIGYLIRIAVVPVVIFGVVAATGVWIVVGQLAKSGIVTEDTAAAVQFAAPFLGVGALLAVGLGAVRGLGHIVAFTTIQNVTLPILRLAGIGLVLVFGLSLVGLTFAWMVPAVLALLATGGYLYHHLRRLAPDTPSWDVSASPEQARPRGAREFWSFSSARGVSSILEIILEWIDVLAVALFLGPAQAGIYGVVTRCVRVGQMVEHTARIVTSPLISAAFAIEDRVKVQEIFLSASRLLVLCAWPFYLLLLIHADAILELFGPGFSQGSAAMGVISLAMMVAVSAGGVQSMLLMGGKSRWQLINKSVALVAAITLNIILVPLWGIAGAAVAWGTAVLLDCMLATLAVWYSMKVRVSPVSLLLPAGLALLTFGGPALAVRVSVGSNGLSLALAILIGGICYLCSVILFRRRLNLDQLRGRA